MVLIAAIGFVNYVLWKLYGSSGVGPTGFLGGLVNRTVTAAELANRVRESGGALADSAERGVLLATAASMARNGVLLGLLALGAFAAAGLPLALMFAASLGFALLPALLRRVRPPVVRAVAGAAGGEQAPTLRLESPFSLRSALKFGLIFLLLEVTGTLAQQALGQFGFYAVSIAGGLVSSASAVASAGTLAAKGARAPDVAARGAILAALTSAGVNVALVARLSGSRRLVVRLGQALALVLVLGMVGVVAQPALLATLARARG